MRERSQRRRTGWSEGWLFTKSMFLHPRKKWEDEEPLRIEADGTLSYPLVPVVMGPLGAKKIGREE